MAARKRGARAIRHAFAAASGPSLADCHWVGLRFAGPAFKPATGDSWIGASDASRHRSHGNTPGWVTGMWRSERQVWASLAAGRVSMRPSLGADEVVWQSFALDATLMGIWGLRDDLVFTWGMRRTERVAFRFDGEAWREIEVPGFVVPIGGVRIAESELMLGCVAKLGDEVWVGAGEDGLLRLDGDALEPVEPGILAERFDARGRLLITTPDALVETADGRRFTSTPIAALEQLTAGTPPKW